MNAGTDTSDMVIAVSVNSILGLACRVKAAGLCTGVCNVSVHGSWPGDSLPSRVGGRYFHGGTADLRNLETGLNVNAYCHDLHHFCTEQRINDFIANLSVVGYRTEKRPLSPLGGARTVIVSFDPVW